MMHIRMNLLKDRWESLACTLYRIRCTGNARSFSCNEYCKRRSNGRNSFAILAEGTPTDRAKNVVPTLEDYYLFVFDKSVGIS